MKYSIPLIACRKSNKRLWLMGFAIATLAVPVHAALILSENFDSYADQAAFQAAWPANTTTAVLSTAQAVSPTQSVAAGTTAMRNARGVGEIGFLNGTSDIVEIPFQLLRFGGLGLS